MLDIILWPIVERLPCLKIEHGYEAIPERLFPKFYRWREAMMDMHCVQDTIMSPEVHLEYIRAARSGVYNYDPEHL